MAYEEEEYSDGAELEESAPRVRGRGGGGIWRALAPPGTPGPRVAPPIKRLASGGGRARAGPLGLPPPAWSEAQRAAQRGGLAVPPVPGRPPVRGGPDLGRWGAGMHAISLEAARPLPPPALPRSSPRRPAAPGAP